MDYDPDFAVRDGATPIDPADFSGAVEAPFAPRQTWRAFDVGGEPAYYTDREGVAWAAQDVASAVLPAPLPPAPPVPQTPADAAWERAAKKSADAARFSTAGWTPAERAFNADYQRSRDEGVPVHALDRNWLK